LRKASRIQLEKWRLATVQLHSQIQDQYSFSFPDVGEMPNPPTRSTMSVWSQVISAAMVPEVVLAPAFI